MNKRIRCIVVDDEPLALELMTSYVRQTPFLELVGSYDNPLLALESAQRGEGDLLFLDINMPQLTGLDLAPLLPEGVRIIFTTAYSQYALESYKLNALDYLVKPISYPEFVTAANKAKEWFELKQGSEATISTDESRRSIFVKSGYRIERIQLASILYIENQKDYVKFHFTTGQPPITSLMNLQLLEDYLPEAQFMRIHRSFIVNLDNIQTIERNCVVYGKEYIPVSDTYKDKFNEFLNRSFFLGRRER